jgi:hypothetical protein
MHDTRWIDAEQVAVVRDVVMAHTALTLTIVTNPAPQHHGGVGQPEPDQVSRTILPPAAAASRDAHSLMVSPSGYSRKSEPPLRVEPERAACVRLQSRARTASLGPVGLADAGTSSAADGAPPSTAVHKMASS